MNSKNICSRCILDDSIQEINFDENNICNFCHIHDEIDKKYELNEKTKNRLNGIINKIKTKGKNKKYDCIVGVSGGRDSTYTLYQAVSLGLRPLAVHFDNGWNSKIAVKNIHNATKILNVDLETIVANWEEFKDLQLSFLKASVSDGEVPTDWVIFSVLFNIAKKEGIKYIIQGHSFRTEGSTPLSWTYMDGKYVKSVHKLFGKKTIKSFPVMSMFDYFKYSILYRIKQIRILYYLDYDEKTVMDLLKTKLGWTDYGGKHFESSYTSFFQSYILMKKFNIDKRKLHLSALIRSGQINRESSLKIINKNPYTGGKEQLDYVIKKLGITNKDFNNIMNNKIKTFADYRTYYNLIKYLEKPLKFANKINLVPDSVINKFFKL
tara:strand:- start:560 stop:1696 length:1137 start_codon:yes stop_codon:yes gene_type:complete